MKKMNKFTAATAAFALPAMVFAPAAHAATFGDELLDAFTLPIASAQAGDQDDFKAAEVNKQEATNENPGTTADTGTGNTGTEGGENSVSTYNNYEAGNGQARAVDNTGGASDGTGVDQGAGNGTTGGDTGAGDQGSGNPGTGDIDGTTPPAPQPETQPAPQPGTQEQAPETTAPQPETQAPATTENQSPGTVTQQPTATATQEQQAPVVADTTEQAPTVEAAPAPETLPVTGGGVSEMAWAAGAAAALALAAGAVGFRRQEQA